MKTLLSITLRISITIFSCPLCLNAEEVKPYDVFVELRERIEQSDKSTAQINAIASDLKTAIQDMDFSDDSLTGPDSWKLRFESQRAVSGLTSRSDFKESKPSELTDPVIECISLYLEKIQALIDPDWEWEDVSVANVSPPDGVPFSMPGMDPDAIEDPILRAKYLELIANAARINQRNGKQSKWRQIRSSILDSLQSLANNPNYPHWTKESVEARFGTSPALLAAIREYWAAEE